MQYLLPYHTRMRSFFGAEELPEGGQNALYHWDTPGLANQLMSCSDRHVPNIRVVHGEPKDPKTYDQRYIVSYFIQMHLFSWLFLQPFLRSQNKILKKYQRE